MVRDRTLGLLLFWVAGCSGTAANDGGASPLAGWRQAGSLSTSRQLHTATLVGPGRVLVAGGLGSDGSALASTELVDVASGVVLAGRPLAAGRQGHSATVLADGRVLLAGGLDGGGALASVEVYEPQTGAWRPAAPLARARHGHIALALDGGTRVLVAGGLEDRLGSAVLECELYDVERQSWSPAGRLARGRAGPTGTLLADGRVLLAGGSAAGQPLESVEVWDPTLKTWVAARDLSEARAGHAAALLGDGSVLVVGGGTAAVDLLDPAALQLRSLAPLPSALSGHTLTALPDGRALLVGGQGDASVFDYSAEVRIFDGASQSWTASAALHSARAGHRATWLPSGSVLISGGVGPDGPLSALELGGPFGAAGPGDAGPSSDADALHHDADLGAVDLGPRDAPGG